MGHGKAHDTNLTKGRRVITGEHMKQIVKLKAPLSQMTHVITALVMCFDERRLAKQVDIKLVQSEVALEFLTKRAVG